MSEYVKCPACQATNVDAELTRGVVHYRCNECVQGRSFVLVPTVDPPAKLYVVVENEKYPEEGYTVLNVTPSLDTARMLVGRDLGDRSCVAYAMTYNGYDRWTWFRDNEVE